MGAGLLASQHLIRQLGDGHPRRGRALLISAINATHPEDTMPVARRPRRAIPANAPAYYLGRPASVWINITTGHPEAPQDRR